jgi:hypothetical protein
MTADLMQAVKIDRGKPIQQSYYGYLSRYVI